MLKKLPSSFVTPISFRKSDVELNNLLRELRDESGLNVYWRPPDVQERKLLSKLNRKAHAVDDESSASLLCPVGTNTKVVEGWLMSEWATRWRKVEGHRQSKYWLKEPSGEIANGFVNMERSDLSVAIQCLTGHGWLRRHCHVVDNSVDPTCRLCLEDDEEPAHLFWDCPAIARERTSILGEERTLARSWSHQELRRFLSIPQVLELFQG